MTKHIFVLTGLLLICSGCTTTTPPSAVNELQIQVAQLQSRLAQRDSDIEELQFIVKELSEQVTDIEAMTDSAIEEPSVIRKQVQSQLAPTQAKLNVKSAAVSTEFKTEDIIRVPVSTQEIQRALQAAGYYQGKIDGKFGTQSQSAVKEFQRDHELKSDGIVGKKTWSEMKNYLE